MSKIIDAQDILNGARSCIECIFMAAESLDIEKASAIQHVADMASKGIEEAIAILKECDADGGAAEVPGEEAIAKSFLLRSMPRTGRRAREAAGKLAETRNEARGAGGNTNKGGIPMTRLISISRADLERDKAILFDARNLVEAIGLVIDDDDDLVLRNSIARPHRRGKNRQGNGGQCY
jgi:hypothetical protein